MTERVADPIAEAYDRSKPLQFHGHRDLTSLELETFCADIENAVEWDNDGCLLTDGFAKALQSGLADRGYRIVRVVDNSTESV